MSEKRNRESEEDKNERVAKTLALTDVVQKAEAEFLNLSKAEQDQFGFQKFSNLPIDVQKLIASMNVGVLMNMAQISRMFAMLARQDWLWKRCFERDYPKEYAFCRGELPFYVVNKSHPFWYNGFVKPEDEPAWKRFYLHVANQYRKYVGNFVKVWRDVEKDVTLGIDMQYTTSREIYNFCHRIILGKQLDWFDWRCKLAWYFVCTIVWYFKYQRRFNTNRSVAWSFWNIARVIPEYQWLLPFLTHSGVASDEKQDYTDEEPSPKTISILFRTSEYEGADLVAENFEEYVQKNPPWKKPTLFTEENRINLLKLIDTQRNNGEFRRRENYEDDDFFNRQSEKLIVIWDMLSYCYHNPCLFSLGKHIPNAYMIYKSKELQARVEKRRIRGESNNQLFLYFTEQHRDQFKPMSNPLLVVSETTDLEIFIEHGRIFSLFAKYKKLPRTDTGVIKYIQSSCISCGTILKEPKMCGGMCNNKSIVFCGTECQTIHWKKGHYKECGKK